eukprot:gb/GECG01009876.1/.p1 GENE.gb/GECG01009876.1/~~gb/GECG01009876.1/.p1  ORF type:complete len:230 (+),score=21.49 gb/GECG01009876.1/:1-690(+)
MPSRKNKKNQSGTPRAPPVEVSKAKQDTSEAEEEAIELAAIDTDDQTLVRRILEDELADVLEEEVGFTPNFSLSNIKLVLMTVTLFIGVIAHFVPNPYVESAVSNPVYGVQERLGRISSFPLLDNNQLLGACVILFFTLQGILQVMQWTWEANYVYMSHPSKTKFGSFPSLYFRAYMPKNSYDFTVEVRDSRNHKLASWSTTAYKYFTQVSESYQLGVYGIYKLTRRDE